MYVSNKQKTYISSFTRSLKELQWKVPIISDKSLIDLVNGIQVSKNIISYRKKRNFFGQLSDILDGSDHERQILLNGNLIAGQEALSNWVLELCNSLHISQVALEITQNSLLEARNAIRSQKSRLERQEEAILQFDKQLHQLTQQVGIQLSNLEAKVRQLQVRVAAMEDLDRIVSAWTAEQTYTQFPWVFGVALLAREVFSSSVVMYEFETGDQERFRQLLVNKILATSKQFSQSFFGLADLLDTSWAEMAHHDRELAAELLEVRSIPFQQLANTPYLFIIGTTLELATLPKETRPSKPSQSALALCQNQISLISRTTNTREFVTNIVEEIANDCLATISRSYSR